MTTRNLNQTWRDVLFNQYDLYHAINVPFPGRYIIFAPPWHRDILSEITKKLDPQIFHRSVQNFVTSKQYETDPAFSNGHILIWVG